MLNARKIHLATGLKVSGLGLRKAELEFYFARYAAVGAISSIECAFAYVGMIKIKIPVEFEISFNYVEWQVFLFYVADALVLCLSLFNVILSGFLPSLFC